MVDFCYIDQDFSKKEFLYQFLYYFFCNLEKNQKKINISNI